MGAITDFLFGKNREQIDKDYSSALKSAGEERARAVEQAVYNGQLYNANKDLFEEKGIEQPITGGEVSSAYADEMNNLEKERAKAWKQNKYNVLGNGMIGSLINPVIQAGSIAGDMFASPFRAMAGEETNRYRRDPENDFISDLGAIGETGITLGTLGGGAGAKTLGKTIGKGALMGAGYGATGTLREQGGNTDLGSLLLATGIGAGVGGGISGLGYGAGKLWNKYSAPAPSSSTEIVPYAGATNSANPQLQEYMRTLGVSGNVTEDALNTAKRQAAKNIANTVGFESAEGQAQRTAVNNAYQALLENLRNGGVGAGQSAVYVAPTQSFGNKLKTFVGNVPQMGKDVANSKLGTKVSSILGTKAGKVGAGVGGGLLLAKLLSGNKNNANNLSDADMQELYNYIYGGGQ